MTPRDMYPMNPFNAGRYLCDTDGCASVATYRDSDANSYCPSCAGRIVADLTATDQTPSDTVRAELSERTRIVGEGLASVRDELTKLRDQIKLIDTRAEAAQRNVRSMTWNRLTVLSEVADRLIDAGEMTAYRLVSDMITAEVDR